jgi:hypothetical protein
MKIIQTLLLMSVIVPILPAVAPRDFLPLAAGNRWTYRDARTGQTLDIHVQTPVMHEGNPYYKVTGYTSAPAYLRHGENGNIFAWDEDLQRELLVTSFEVVPGGWYDTQIAGCPQGAQVQEGSVLNKATDMPDITAIQIEYRTYGCADTGILEERYAENIGLLHRVVSTIAGPVTYDLLYAATPSLTYDTRRGNTFQVSLHKNYLECGLAGSDQIVVGLLLSSRLAPSIELLFPTAQRYDIRVRNDAGDVAYQWSDDVAFAQVASAVVTGRDLEYSQTIPLRTRSGGSLPGGYYTVEAWLATANREFAGATRFFYSACDATTPAILRDSMRDRRVVRGLGTPAAAMLGAH